jgi:hypothetical protein
MVINQQLLVSEGVKNLLLTMLVAVFGTLDSGAPCSRAIEVVTNTPDLIIWVANVGVHCSSMN